MKDNDPQDFLDSVMVFERETIPAEFYGDPTQSKFSNTGSVVQIKDSVYIEVPSFAQNQLSWHSTDTLHWEVIDEETVVISKKRR